MSAYADNKARFFDNPKGGNVAKHRKEKHFASQLTLVTVKGGAVAVLAEARFYNSPTGAANYACVWIRTPDAWRTGGGKAGGYGYHRPSAALDNALHDAGVKLESRIDGCGDQAMESALLAVGEAMGFKRARLQILRAHA